MEKCYLISDAAKEINVESHVLRYWEDELGLPIKRNELGHRYYTEEDVELFRQIKDLKDKGLQLKAIRAVMRGGRLEAWSKGAQCAFPDREEKRRGEEPKDDESAHGMAITIVESREDKLFSERKALRIQSLLRQIIQETVRESSVEICREIKEGLLKELDYQFRLQEERQEERDQQQQKRNEEYYRRMDELLREKSGRDDRKQGKKLWRGLEWKRQVRKVSSHTGEKLPVCEVEASGIDVPLRLKEKG